MIDVSFLRYGAAASQIIMKIISDLKNNERVMNVLDGACNVCLVSIDESSFTSSASSMSGSKKGRVHDMMRKKFHQCFLALYRSIVRGTSLSSLKNDEHDHSITQPICSTHLTTNFPVRPSFKDKTPSSLIRFTLEFPIIIIFPVPEQMIKWYVVVATGFDGEY